MLACAQITIRDENDIQVSAAAPVSPVLDELWLDTSVTPNRLRRWDGAAWAACGAEPFQNEVVVGTQTAATGAWTGVASFPLLTDGQQITYWLPCAGSGTATLTLTLGSGAATPAIPCYYGGTTRLTTHYAAGNAIHFTYRENVTIGATTVAAGWWADANYDTNSYDRIRLNNAIKAKSAIAASRFIVSDAGGYFPLTAGAPFDMSKPILWAGSAIATNATGTNNYLAFPTCTLRNNRPGFSGTNSATCYIVGTLDGDAFTPAAGLFTTTAPAEEDGHHYIALGLMVSAYQIYLYPEHPIYRFAGGAFKPLTQIGYEASEEVMTKVGKGTVISEINQSAEEISISAEKIDLNGVVTANENFRILPDGSMEAVNGRFTGAITAPYTDGANRSGVWTMDDDGLNGHYVDAMPVAPGYSTLETDMTLKRDSVKLSGHYVSETPGGDLNPSLEMGLTCRTGASYAYIEAGGDTRLRIASRHLDLEAIWDEDTEPSGLITRSEPLLGIESADPVYNRAPKLYLYNSAKGVIRVLWHNASPASTFPAQTVTLEPEELIDAFCDLWVCLYAISNNSNTVVKMAMGRPNETLYLDVAAAFANGANCRSRSARVDAVGNSVIFSNATTATGAAAQSTNNAYCIPLMIGRIG